MAKQIVSLSAGGFNEAVRSAAAVLSAGGVAVFPTDTVYGIGVAAGNAAASRKLRRLKGREAGKPFQFLAADLAMARVLGAVFSPAAERLARAFWPGGLTLVVPHSGGGKKGGEEERSGTATIGVRVPASDFVQALCRELGRGLVTSSANKAGGAAPANANDADAFGMDVDILIDGGVAPDGVASTVASCVDGELKILRPGGVTEDALRAVWELKAC